MAKNETWVGKNVWFGVVEPGACFISSTSALLNIALAFGFTLFVVIYFTASFSGQESSLENPSAIIRAQYLTPWTILSDAKAQHRGQDWEFAP